MDPAFINAVTTVLRDYGLPLAILLVFGWLVITGRLRTEGDAKRQEDEIAFREKLRVEERDSRLAAEARLADMVAVIKTHSDLLREIERDVLRGQARDDH